MTDSPHAVLPSDEARHAPDPDDLWNESYYCDFVQGDGSWGGWLRLGLYPNRDVAWWTAWVVRPGEEGGRYVKLADVIAGAKARLAAGARHVA